MKNRSKYILWPAVGLCLWLMLSCLAGCSLFGRGTTQESGTDSTESRQEEQRTDTQEEQSTDTQTGHSDESDTGECSHVFGEWVIVREPDCSGAGQRTRTCTLCHITETELLPALEHTVVTDPAVPATCTQSGKTEGSHCSVCGAVLVPQQDILSLGHDWVEDAGHPATCTEDGLSDGSHCAVCGEVRVAQTEIPATGHVTVIDPGMEATCTRAGHSQGAHCAVCGEVLQAQEEIPPTGHTVVADPGVAPTCTEHGYSEGSHCSVCGTILKKQEILPATGHTFGPEATCTEPQTCLVCGVIVAPAEGHIPQTDPAVAPTCTQDGLTEGSHCAVCGLILEAQQVLPALEHVPVEDPAVPATCTTHGLNAGSHCSVCGQVLVEQTVIPATGHSMVVLPAQAPTCTAEGHTQFIYCRVCGEAAPGSVLATIPPTGHAVVTDPAVPPTATESGLTEGAHCATCGKILLAQETVPPTGLPEEMHPGDASLYAGVLISAVYGTGKANIDAYASHGFIQLYNRTDRDISLAGASLYYKKDMEDNMTEFRFPEGAVIPAGGYYLVRANSPAGYDMSCAVLRIDAYDAAWDIYIDNKEVSLLLAPSGWTILPGEDVTAFDDGVSVFLASETPHGSVYATDDLSKKKVAVRTALVEYSGFHIVNLTKTATPELEKISPRTADGTVNPVMFSYLDEVFFSHTAGLYDQEISLKLSAAEGYTVYYTTDGTDPRTSPSATVFSQDILLKDSSNLPIGPLTLRWVGYGGRQAKPGVDSLVGGYVIKAYATDGSVSTPVYTNTYFIATNLAELGVSVVSISLPQSDMIGSEGFYNHYSELDEEGSRPRGLAVMEVFDPDGNRVGHANVELAVSGQGSAINGMKSLRIYYKSANNIEGGMDSDLNYDLFGGLCTDTQGQAITSFSRLLLRDSGQDCGYSGFRDAYMQRMSAGLCIDTMASATTLVFVNGEFWGVYNFRERYSPEYVESHYGVDKDNVVVIENDFSQYYTDWNAPYVVTTGEEGDADPFNQLVDFILTQDMSQPEAFAYVSSLMDMDSLIDMYVARLFFNAQDWPENNIKVWRNKNPTDPSGMDTKWHFTLLDTDRGLSLQGSETTNIFSQSFNKNSVCASMTVSLLENQSFKECFLARYYTVVTEYYSEEWLLEELQNFIDERTPLMPLQADRWPTYPAFSFTMDRWYAEVEKMQTFVQNRHQYALSQMYAYFKVSEADVLEIIARQSQEDQAVSE